jgi:hypothetical protein
MGALATARSGCRSSLTCEASIERTAPYLPLLAAPVTEAEINAFTPANLDAFTLSVFDADNKLLPPPARMHVHDTLHVADIMPTLFSVCPSLMLFWLDEFPRRSLTLMATDCRNR